jgi:hypothetical protein
MHELSVAENLKQSKLRERMKVFISWSKSLSQECAEILQEWIKCTLQASQPWMSSQDLDKGTVWFNEINTQLSDTTIGIVCLTQENKNNPWILFEAGALAKGLTDKRVYTLLIDLKPSDIEPPLSQFNHTSPTKADMKKLLISINKQLGDNGLEDKILNQVFETYWPQFYDRFKKAIKEHPPGEDVKDNLRTPDDMLLEILNTTRHLDKRIRHVEQINRNNVVLANRDLNNSVRMKPQASINKSIHDLGVEVRKLIDKGYVDHEIFEMLQGIWEDNDLLSAISGGMKNR